MLTQPSGALIDSPALPSHKMLDELKALLKHTSVYGVGNLLNKLVGFLLIPFYTHYLTPGDYGTLELLDLSVALFGLAVMMWMNAAIIRYYYEYEDRKNRSEVIGTILVMAFLVGIVSTACGITFSRQLSSLILKSPIYYKFFWFLSITFCFSTLNSVSFSYLRAKQRSGLVTTLSVVTMLLSLGLNIYFIAILKTGVIGILYSTLITTALSATVLTVYTLREIDLRFSFSKLKAIAIFGAPLVITSLSAFALNFSDRFFLQRFTNVSTVGIYALGYKFAFMMSFLIVQPFDMIWSSRMYDVAKRPNGADLFSRIFRYYSLVLIAVALGISLIIKDLIGIVAAPSFHDAYKIVPVVALAYVFQGSYRFMVGGIYVEKKTRSIGMISAASLALNLILNYLLIPHFAAMGAAWATALSFLFMAGLSYVVSERVHPVSYRLGAFFVAIAVAAVLYWCTVKISIPSIFLSTSLKFVVFISFPVVLYLIGFFNKDEVDTAKRTVQALWATRPWGAAVLPE
jgi:O-antigen/teichoic acid export membrane protein